MKTQTIAPKRWWYIMPIVFITYSLAYLDRANFSFASAAGINDDLGITKGMSSLLGAFFFLGLFLFPDPRHGLSRTPQREKTDFLVPDFMGRLRVIDRRGGSGGNAGDANLHQ